MTEYLSLTSENTSEESQNWKMGFYWKVGVGNGAEGLKYTNAVKRTEISQRCGLEHFE